MTGSDFLAHTHFSSLGLKIFDPQGYTRSMIYPTVVGDLGDGPADPLGSPHAASSPPLKCGLGDLVLIDTAQQRGWLRLEVRVTEGLQLLFWMLFSPSQTACAEEAGFHVMTQHRGGSQVRELEGILRLPTVIEGAWQRSH